MKLYNLPLSPNARKPLLIAHEIGIALEIVNVDVRKGENRTPEFLAKNPNGQMPLLEDGDFLLSESNAIALYLASLRPEKGLLPSDPKALAHVHQWLFWQTASWGPAFGDVVYERLLKGMFGLGEPNAEKVDAALKKIARLSKVLNQALEGKTFLVGGQLSVADLCVASWAMYREPASIDLKPYPALLAWLTRIEERDSWKATAPTF